MDMYSAILDCLKTGEPAILATIISTSGSTPASALSKMLVKQGGAYSVGTVGGGCMEGDVILKARKLLESEVPSAEILTFHLNEHDAEHGLICGGTLHVLLEPLGKEHTSLYQELLSGKDRGDDNIVATLIDPQGRVLEKRILTEFPPDSLITRALASQSFRSEEIIPSVMKRSDTLRLSTESGEVIFEPIAGTPRLVIVGGGHVSKSLCRAAAMVGFSVSVLDDRSRFANPERFPDASRTLVVDFNDAFAEIPLTASSYLVIVTRGHAYDEIVLAQALASPAMYIGMIGSKRKVLTAFGHLRERGIGEIDLARVHAPVGIDIGAVTPEEIAVSIVAELIAIRRKASEPFFTMSRATSVTASAKTNP